MDRNTKVTLTYGELLDFLECMQDDGYLNYQHIALMLDAEEEIQRKIENGTIAVAGD